jgi:hypothetical protein
MISNAGNGRSIRLPFLCQALENEGVWHFVGPKEPTITSFYDSELEIAPQVPQASAAEPIHIDPTTMEGFIPHVMRVNGKSVEVRAKYVIDRILDGHPIPDVRNFGGPFSVFQENQYRLAALKDIETARGKR